MAVPIHGPSTPHRINMPSEDINEKATITTNGKQSVITLLSPLQVVKKSAPRGRKKAVSNQSINHRSLKPQGAETNHSITDYFPIRRSVRKSKKTVLEEKQRDLENKVLCQVEEGLEVRTCIIKILQKYQIFFTFLSNSSANKLQFISYYRSKLFRVRVVVS